MKTNCHEDAIVMKTMGMRALAAVAVLGAAGAVGTAPAGAADMGMTAPVPKAPYSWSGCYFGGTLGWGAANDWVTKDVGNAAGLVENPGGGNPWTFSLNSGVLVGGTVGCNWQPAAFPLVLGIEGEGGWLRLNGPGNQPAGTGAGNVSDASRNANSYGLIAGRVGWAFLERILVYGKVGVAFYDAHSTVTDVAAPGIVATGGKPQSPLATGGGVEYAFDDHWTGKAEYMYFDRGTSYLSCGVTAGASFCWSDSPSPIHTFKVGLNYKF
jgi:outer membrane immunogenic protein